jgi:2'-5' RNA ligase
MRTFIAIYPSQEIKDVIGELIARLKKDGDNIKWVEAKDLHITLKFLGEVKEQDVSRLIDIVSGALKGRKAFQNEFIGIGTFPEKGTPRVIWIGTAKGALEQKEMAATIEETLSEAGYKKEERPFTPHLTIGRVKGKTDSAGLKAALEDLKEKKIGVSEIVSVEIMKSKLKRSGAAYEIVKSFSLIK